MSKASYRFGSVLILSLMFFIQQTVHADFSVFAISPDLWQQGVVDQPFSLQLQVGGGTAPYTWSVTNGTLPDGVNLNAATGLISGNPTTTGSDPVTVQAQDANGATAAKDYSLIVSPSVGGLSYSRTPSGSTVSNPVTIHLRGVFGADICDSASTAYQLFVGTYPHFASITYQSATQGTVIDQGFTVTLPLDTYSGVYVNCFGGSSGQRTTALDNASFSMFAISPEMWQQGVVGQAFSLQLQAGGGTAPYTWSVTSGMLPDGVSLNAATGLISGNPTTEGSDPVTAQAQDANGATATKDYALVVYPSDGGFAYSRTPSGSVVSNPVTFHLKGTFGADFCDSASTSYQLSVGTFPHSAVINYQNVAQGTVIDQDFTATLPLDTYSGVYLTCFGESSGQRGTTLESSLQIVNNQSPVLAPIGNKVINEGQTLSFTLNATDPDGDALTYSASNLPSGATFDPTSHTFTWTPSYGQAGNYTNVEFTVMDNGTPMMLADELITISVGHVNRPPVFALVGPQQASTTAPMSFNVSASDPDGDAVTLTASNIPSGATFNPNTGLFAWTPNYSQAGVYTVTFTATDNGTPTIASSTLGVVISVSTSPPTTVTQNLINEIIATSYPTNQLNAYLANLQKVVIFINGGKIQPAINQLNAFIQKVNQDYQKGLLTQTQRNYLVGEAQSIISTL